MDLTLEELIPICKERITECRIPETSERYGESLSFYLKHDFYFEDCWNLDTTLAALILPRLVYYRHNHAGVPNCFCKIDGNFKVTNLDEAGDEWDRTLDKMIEAFWEIVQDRTLEVEEKERQQIQKTIDEGLKLFGEHFQSLWD